jgi:hypothetical protein
MAKTRRPSRPSPSRLRTPAPTRQRKRRVSTAAVKRVVLVVVGAAATTALAGAVWSWTRPGPPDIAPEQPVASYRVLYTTQSGDGPRMEEERIVDRPYRGSDIIRDASGAITTGQTFTDDGYFIYQVQNHGWAQLAAKRHLPGFDYRLVSVLRDQLHRRRAQVVGHRRIAGHACDLIRIGSAVGDTEAFKRPSEKNHADVCVDRSGVMLSETWVLRGKVARRTQASAFIPGYTVPADAFSATPRVAGIPATIAGQAAVDLDASGRATFRARVEPFDGFRDDGGIVEVSISPNGAGGGVATIRYRRGFDVIEMSQRSSPPPSHPGDREVTVAPWGDVQFHPDPLASTYDVPIGEGQWIRLKGANLKALDGALRHLKRVKAK